jgi:hypothetical protein
MIDDAFPLSLPPSACAVTANVASLDFYASLSKCATMKSPRSSNRPSWNRPHGKIQPPSQSRSTNISGRSTDNGQHHRVRQARRARPRQLKRPRSENSTPSISEPLPLATKRGDRWRQFQSGL